MKHSPCLAAALACFAAAAFAQTPSSRDIYMYQGADREARLVAGAKKERQVVLYSTMTVADGKALATDRKSTRLNSSHSQKSYAVFCLKKKKKHKQSPMLDTGWSTR